MGDGMQRAWQSIRDKVDFAKQPMAARKPETLTEAYEPFRKREEKMAVYMEKTGFKYCAVHNHSAMFANCMKRSDGGPQWMTLDELRQRITQRYNLEPPND